MLRKNKQTPQEQSDQEFNLALEVPAEQRPKGWRPFVRRNWKRIAAAACAAAVAGAFLLPGNGAKPAGVDTEYLESAVERRNITNVFSGSGTIAAANTYTVNALVSGTVLTADFAVGDTIEEGTVLYTIDSSNTANSVEKAQLSLDQAQRNYEDAVDAQYVRSTIGGTLTSYKVAVGDVVNAGQEVATVRDASTLLLTLEFPAADAANFTVGQAAQVTLDGTFEQFKAYVDAHADQNPSCLCFTGEAEKLGWPCVEYGREGDGADQAKHIFRSLRALDEQGDGVVYARCPKKDGLSMAVYNRLIRAAAFRVIQL